MSGPTNKPDRRDRPDEPPFLGREQWGTSSVSSREGDIPIHPEEEPESLIETSVDLGGIIIIEQSTCRVTYRLVELATFGSKDLLAGVIGHDRNG